MRGTAAAAETEGDPKDADVLFGCVQDGRCSAGQSGAAAVGDNEIMSMDAEELQWQILKAEAIGEQQEAARHERLMREIDVIDLAWKFVLREDADTLADLRSAINGLMEFEDAAARWLPKGSRPWSRRS